MEEVSENPNPELKLSHSAKDATADYSDEEMHAALEVNLPGYANAIVTTTQIVDSILLFEKKS